MDVRTFGVEEELLLVDPDGGGLRAVSDAVIRYAREHGGVPLVGAGNAGIFETELQREQLEMCTLPCATLDELAEQVALMVPAYSTFDLVEIARDTGREVTEVAEVYFELADRLQLARVRERIIALPRGDRWNTMARAALRDDLYAAHGALTRDVLMSTEPGLSPEKRLIVWSDKNSNAVARAQRTLGEIWESDTFDLATLSVALGAIRNLVTASTLPGLDR